MGVLEAVIPLDRFRWYRRLQGGHWEKWYVDVPVCSDVWHKVRRCTYDRQGHAVRRYPTPLCRGRARCEDYPHRHYDI